MSDDDDSASGVEDMPAPTEHTSAIRASEVIGREIFHVSGEKIGKVDDIVFDATGNSIIAIISFGGAVTTSDDSHPLPLSVLDYSGDRGGYVVAFTKEQIVNGSAGAMPARDAKR